MFPHQKTTNPRIPDKHNITPKCLAIPRESLNSKMGTRLKRWNPLCFWELFRVIVKCRGHGFYRIFPYFTQKYCQMCPHFFGWGHKWEYKKNKY